MRGLKSGFAIFERVEVRRWQYRLMEMGLDWLVVEFQDDSQVHLQPWVCAEGHSARGRPTVNRGKI